MKKKLLSLVLAGAMVASTSVSAFADTTEEKTYVIDSVGKDHQVDITGNVANTSDEVVPVQVKYQEERLLLKILAKIKLKLLQRNLQMLILMQE